MTKERKRLPSGAELEKRRSAVLAILQRAGSNGLTLNEIFRQLQKSTDLNLSKTQVRSCLHGLIKLHPNLVRRTSKRQGRRAKWFIETRSDHYVPSPNSRKSKRTEPIDLDIRYGKNRWRDDKK